MSLSSSSGSQNEDIKFLDTSTNGQTKSPVRKRASHQSPNKGLNANTNNIDNKQMNADHDSDGSQPNWNWKINSQHLEEDETESQPLKLNRKNKSQKESTEHLQETQEDKSADESKSRNHSNNNSQNIDMTLELAKERLQIDDKEGSQENIELRRQKLLLLKQMEAMQQDNNENIDDLTLDPNATIAVNIEPEKRKVQLDVSI